MAIKFEVTERGGLFRARIAGQNGFAFGRTPEQAIGRARRMSQPWRGYRDWKRIGYIERRGEGLIDDESKD
ncbi:MAG TPA: hypothetical protein VFA85_18655 [Terriglobales bacterium]|nr:hypothetical protein [Terriglobales bacterium]